MSNRTIAFLFIALLPLAATMPTSFHQLSFTSIKGEEQPLKDYEGKVLLVVNTASECGFTSQYDGLEQLWDTYKDQGLVVIAFPCNQFGGQEPGGEAEIQNFCSTKFAISFPMSEKVEVNGKNAHPIFKYLKKEAPGLLGSKDIKWNFTKFLISRDGDKIIRYGSMTKPKSISKDIESMLQKPL